MPTQSLPPSDSHPAAEHSVIIGIDWADREHAVCLIDPHGRATHQTLPHSPEAIDEWAAALAGRFPGQMIAIAVEQTKGALVHALLKYEHFLLFPLNPRQLACYREALDPSGSKGDPADAFLLAQFLHHHRQHLRPLQPDTPATRKLARFSEIRRKIVDERARLTLQLKSTLKQYFPQALSLDFVLLLDLLQRWPTLAQIQRAHPLTLRTFLRQHGIAAEERQTEFIQAFRAAIPLTRDDAVIEPAAAYAALMARQLHELNRTIEQFDRQLAVQTEQHPDAAIFRSLPGAGDALVPRLIAAFGTDRERFQSAHQVQCYSGIAPVTRQSGKTRHTSSRHACPKFLRQTFHEFAEHARRWSSWSAAFYRARRDAGSRHQAAVRALAFKWIRILFRLWKTRSTYDENVYIQQLRKRNSPLLKSLEIA